jgi:hypothetical protein
MGISRCAYSADLRLVRNAVTPAPSSSLETVVGVLRASRGSGSLVLVEVDKSVNDGHLVRASDGSQSQWPDMMMSNKNWLSLGAEGRKRQ